MLDFWRALFGTGGFMPHGHCYLWNPGLVSLHLSTDLAIGLSYVAISLTLLYLVHRVRREITFSWILVCFGVFIIACGGTHFMEVWTLWTPVYWLSGAVKVVTAAASVLTAAVLPPLVPKGVQLIRSAKLAERDRKHLAAANEALHREILERKSREAEIRALNVELEQRVAARTVQLSDANERLSRKAAIIEHSNDAIVSLNLMGRITSWNPAATRLYGYRAEEMMGGPVGTLAPAGWPLEISDLIERVKGGEEISSFDTRCVRRDGEHIDVRVTLSSIRDESGKIVGTSLIARDFSEWKRTLEMSRLTVEAAPNAMVMTNGDGKIVLVNSQTEKLFGYSRQELLGQSVDILVPARLRHRHPEHRAGFMRGPDTRAMGAGRDLHGLRKDGSEFPVEIGLNPIRTEEGTWVLSAIVDITERKRADELVRLAVEASPSAMVMVDEQGKIVLVNSQTEKLFGYARGELLGQSVDMLLPAAQRNKHREHRSEFMREPTARAMGAGRELRGIRKDGSEFILEIGLNPIAMEQGIWVLSSILDITERKRAEAEIQQLNQDLENRVAQRTRELTDSNAELEAFSYTVSHDLRAPLRQIAGFSNILVEEHASQLTPESRRYLDKVKDGAQQMGALIDALLKLARIGRQAVSRRDTELNGLVSAALEQLSLDCSGRKIDFHIDGIGSVECDPALMKVVFINLLSNAIKYTRQRDSAVIDVGRIDEGPEPVIFVRDNGAGFDMAHSSKLFGVFQRLHKARDFEGTGIGLATVQRIVHKHGGRVWAEAEAGKGATFYFTIPDHSEPPVPQNGDSGKGAP
jgi:PAS domain S-box-containing protein